MAQRIDNFQGNQDQYVQYLEVKVVELLAGCHCRPNEQNSAITHKQRSLNLHGGEVSVESTSNKRSSLAIELWSPRDSNPKRARGDSPRWKKYANELIDELPVGTAWRKTMEQKGIYDAMDTGAAVAYLLHAESLTFDSIHDPPETGFVEVRSGAERLVRVMQGYAQIARQRHRTASVALLLANFQTFVVLSACVVLKATAMVDQADVLSIVRTCLGKVSDDYCARTLHTTKYMNTLIDTLAAHGWDGRAAELVIHWDRKPSFFYPLARSWSASLEHLKGSLSQAKYLSGTEVWAKKNSFFIPNVLCHIFQKEVHIATISHELGYKHAHLFNDAMDVVNPSRMFP